MSAGTSANRRSIRLTHSDRLKQTYGLFRIVFVCRMALRQMATVPNNNDNLQNKVNYE